MVLRLGEKLRAFGRPVFVGFLNVRDPDVEKGAGAVRVGRRRKGDGRLVVRGPATYVQDEPRIGHLHDHRIALDEHLAVEDPLVEVTGAILVRDDQEVGDHEALFWCRKVIWVHIGPPFALPSRGMTPPLTDATPKPRKEEGRLFCLCPSPLYRLTSRRGVGRERSSCDSASPPLAMLRVHPRPPRNDPLHPAQITLPGINLVIA